MTIHGNRISSANQSFWSKRSLRNFEFFLWKNWWEGAFRKKKSQTSFMIRIQILVVSSMITRGDCWAGLSSLSSAWDPELSLSGSKWSGLPGLLLAGRVRVTVRIAYWRSLTFDKIYQSSVCWSKHLIVGLVWRADLLDFFDFRKDRTFDNFGGKNRYVFGCWQGDGQMSRSTKTDQMFERCLDAYKWLTAPEVLWRKDVLATASAQKQ